LEKNTSKGGMIDHDQNEKQVLSFGSQLCAFISPLSPHSSSLHGYAFSPITSCVAQLINHFSTEEASLENTESRLLQNVDIW